MKFTNLFCLALAAIFSLAVAGCSKSGDSNDYSAAAKTELQNVAGVTLDMATQERLDLKIESPVVAQWQPEMKAFGAVIAPFALAAASADLASARASSEVSEKELVRQKELAAQNNASARSLENAQAAATHDQFAYESALAKFKADWGENLSTNAGQILSRISSGQISLARIDLPPDENLPSPAAARLVLATDETNVADAEFFDELPGVDPQTQSHRLLFLAKKSLPPNSAVTAFLKTSGEAIPGVTIPAAAVLRYEGKGWIYEQTGTNQFSRVEIPLDCPTADGWFISENASTNLSATNRIVTVGAATILSAELSSGFDANNRD